MRYMGAAVLGSFIFAQLFFTESVISVWCFFAAIISISIYAIMQDMQIPVKEPEPVLPAL